MVSELGIDPILGWKANQILALGYTEAHRRNAQRAKLDALLEATVAVCDLVPPPVLAADQFYLTDLSLCRPDGTEHSSSLAPFDEDVRSRLEGWFGARVPVHLQNGWHLLLPKDACALVPQILNLWNDFPLEFKPPESVAAIARVSVPDDIAEQFKESLRAAFDAIAREDRRTYTIRIDRTLSGGFQVRDGHTVDYAMGYWLSTSKLLELQVRPDDPFDLSDIKKLEDVWLPEDGRSLRTQSHTNVHTRLAGVVRQQLQRSGNKPNKLEERAWGHPPSGLLMMPLQIHDPSQAEGATRIIAHAYLPVEAGDNDIADLFGRRHRLALVFAENLYEGYCRTLAHDIALRVLESSSIEVINGRCRAIADLFGLQPSVSLLDTLSPSVAVESLAQRLRTLRQRRLFHFDDDYWGPTEWELLGNVALEWTDPQMELDVLPHLIDRVAVLSSRRESSFREVREIVRRQINALQDSMFMVEQTHRSLRDALHSQQSVSLRDVRHLARFFIEPRKVCDAPPNEERRAFGEWMFIPAHDHCGNENCQACNDELERRLGCALGAYPEGNHVEWGKNRDGRTGRGSLFALCGDKPRTVWEVLKQTCYESTLESPRLAAIAVLLCKQGVVMDRGNGGFADAYNYRVRLTPGNLDWERLLDGVWRLATWEAPKNHAGSPGQNATLSLSASGTDLDLVLKGADMNYGGGWVDDAMEAVRAAKDGWWQSSRKRQIAAVLGQREGTGSRQPHEMQARVACAVVDGALVVTVRSLLSGAREMS